jgi:hypothetical protein
VRALKITPAQSYARICHAVLQEMAEHIAGPDNFAGQLIVMGTIIADQKLYEELHRRTRERLRTTLRSANAGKPQSANESAEERQKHKPNPPLTSKPY